MFDMIRTLLGAESPSLEPLQSCADAVLGSRLQVAPRVQGTDKVTLAGPVQPPPFCGSVIL